MLPILAEKLRKTIFRNICHIAHLPKTFGNFSNASLLLQITIFDGKTILLENENVVSKNEEIAYLFNKYLN